MTRKAAKKWLGLGLGCFLCIPFSIGARAQSTSNSTTFVDPADVRLCGTGCVGTPGAVTIITSDTLPTLSFQLTNGGKDTGEAYLAILVPAGNSLPLFTVNGNSATSLTNSVYSSGAFTDFLAANVSNLSLASNSGVNTDFNGFASASAQVTSSPSSFAIYVYDLGAFNGTPLSVTFGNISGFPAGTIFWGFLTNQACSSGSCVLTDTTPLSEAVTVTPEPGTLALAGTGLLLLLLGGMVRKCANDG